MQVDEIALLGSWRGSRLVATARAGTRVRLKVGGGGLYSSHSADSRSNEAIAARSILML